MEFKKEDMIDLNEQNVQRLFAYCLADNATPSENIIKSNFFEKDSGVDIPNMSFDKEKLVQQTEAICYLFGQLNSIHKGQSNMIATDGLKKYDGTNWTQNKVALFALYYLGGSITVLPKFRYFSPFNTFASHIGRRSHILKPTLSPNDPNFKE